MAAKGRNKKWWRRLLQQLDERNGQVTDKEFAAEVGVNLGTLRWWRCHFRREARAEANAAPATTKLVAVEVTGAQPVRAAAPAALRWIEAETSLGVRVRFVEGTGVKYMAELLRRLTSSSETKSGGGMVC